MIFIDASAFLARQFASDRVHDAARVQWRKLEAIEERCVTTNFVIIESSFVNVEPLLSHAPYVSARKVHIFRKTGLNSETLTLVGRRAGCSIAVDLARNLYTSKALTVLRPDTEDEIAALAWFQKYADQQVGFSDCISFALMRKHRLQRVFTFDRHFAAAGFRVVP